MAKGLKMHDQMPVALVQFIIVFVKVYYIPDFYNPVDFSWLLLESLFFFFFN